MSITTIYHFIVNVIDVYSVCVGESCGRWLLPPWHAVALLPSSSCRAGKNEKDRTTRGSFNAACNWALDFGLVPLVDGSCRGDIRCSESLPPVRSDNDYDFSRRHPRKLWIFIAILFSHPCRHCLFAFHFISQSIAFTQQQQH